MSTKRLILAILTFTLILACHARAVEGQSVASDKTGSGDTSASAPPTEPSTIPLQRFTRETVAMRYARTDTLELRFLLTPEFNQTVTVQPDGYITLREVGDLHGRRSRPFRNSPSPLRRPTPKSCKIL